MKFIKSMDGLIAKDFFGGFFNNKIEVNKTHLGFLKIMLEKLRKIT